MNVKVLKGGYNAWKDAGYTLEKEAIQGRYRHFLNAYLEIKNLVCFLPLQVARRISIRLCDINFSTNKVFIRSGIQKQRRSVFFLPEISEHGYGKNSSFIHEK